MSRIIRKLDEKEINDCLLHLREKVKASCYSQISFAQYVSNVTDYIEGYTTIEQAYLQQLIYYKHYLENVRLLAADYLEHDEIVSRLKGYRYRYNEIDDEIAKANEELDAAKKDRDAKKTVRDNAKKAYDTAVSNYNSWINSYYNPTKASLESDLTAANQTLFRERTELTRLRNLYNEKVAAKATAQQDLNAVISALSDTPGSSWTGKTRTFYPSLSITFTYGAGTYTVPAVSDGYSVRYSETSTNVTRGIQVNYINAAGTSVSIVYRVSESTTVTNWWSSLSSAYSGWKAAYLAAYQSAVDSLQDDIDELYDEISNQEEVVYDAEDAVDYIEGELRDLEDEKDEYYEDNVQPALDDYNAAEDAYQAAVQSVTNIENRIKALNTEKGECYDNYNTTWIELRDWESEHEWLGSPNINNFEYPLDSGSYPGQDDDDDDGE